MKIAWKKGVAAAIAAALAIGGFGGAGGAPGHGFGLGGLPSAQAEGTPTTVAVALFIKTNSYNAYAGAVTLSAEGGLTLTDGAGSMIGASEGASAVRASYDGYRVLALTTSDAAKASALASDLKKTGVSVGVFAAPVKGKTTYRVEAGPYGTKAAAEAARVALAGNATMAARLGGAAMTLVGPHYASAGSFGTRLEAEAAGAPLRDAGVYAAPTHVKDAAGTSSWQLWVGGAADDAALKQALAAAGGAVPGLAFAPVNATGTPYVTVRSDVAADAGLAATGVPYFAAGGAGAKLIASPAQAGGAVRVAERSNRVYRGTIEVSAHNGALAAINRLDLETYIAGVVGSELDASWPAEVLKAQAVAARTYVLKQGMKHGIANVVDTTSDQAYRGVEREFPAVVAAVQATAGERLLGPSGQLLDAFYHSNAGNRTADPAEVWNASIPGIGSVPSLDDAAERGKLLWYRIVLSDRRVGYVRSDLLRLSGAVSAAGFPKATAAENGVNVREAPYVNNETNPSIAQLMQGDGVTIIGRDMESSSYQWVRGPIPADRLTLLMTASGVAAADVAALGPLTDISVTDRGASSGRVTAMTINGKTLAVTRPEQYRTLFALPSTRFEVEETASVTVLGGGGRKTERSGGATLTAVGAGGAKRAIAEEAYLITDGDGTARVATKTPSFRFHGTGFGHGLGMSQWGAFGLAELGYDYRKILQYYYKDASIVKE
ncbi:SpoIID/LytB domain-containing protein [Paenibacillus sp. TRM 82003]|nr:SpoIID/LytB domain-containing protein [Paenibacillus sp. TRM 82003]